MIKSFADKHTLALFEDGVCHRRWRHFKDVAVRKLDQLHRISRLDELRIPPKNKLERLQRDRKGQMEHSDQRSISRVFSLG